MAPLAHLGVGLARRHFGFEFKGLVMGCLKSAACEPSLILALVLLMLWQSPALGVKGCPAVYRNVRFWDDEVDRCYFAARHNNYCVPAAVEMVLKYLDFRPLPSQDMLASDMDTNTTNGTAWHKVSYAFRNRGFNDFHESVTRNFTTALGHLRANAASKFPIILRIWYDEDSKGDNGNITHAVVVTGYGPSGVYFHDPMAENETRFFSVARLRNLWNVSGYFWAFVVSEVPRFNLTAVIGGNPDKIGRIAVSLRALDDENGGTQMQTTDGAGTAIFSELIIGSYSLSYQWGDQTHERTIILAVNRTEEFNEYPDVTGLILLCLWVTVTFLLFIGTVVAVRIA